MRVHRRYLVGRTYETACTQFCVGLYVHNIVYIEYQRIHVHVGGYSGVVFMYTSSGT